MIDLITQATVVAEAAKKALALSKKVNNVELEEALLGLRELVQDLRENILALKAENAELRAQAKLRDAVEWDGRVYWTRRDGKKDGPYCPKCHDGDGRLSRMVVLKGQSNPVAKCVVCKCAIGITGTQAIAGTIVP